MSVVLFPFFPNTDRLDDKTLIAQLEGAKAELRVATEAQARAESELAQCSESLRETAEARQRAEDSRNECLRSVQANFLLLVMSWNTADDIDMHIIDPQGREFYFDARRHSGSEARFEEDNVNGPGNEIWVHPTVVPGTYRIDYVFFNGNSRAVAVRGAALHRDGRSALPDITLSQRGQRVTVAQVEVAGDGSVRVR